MGQARQGDQASRFPAFPLDRVVLRSRFFLGHRLRFTGDQQVLRLLHPGVLLRGHDRGRRLLWSRRLFLSFSGLGLLPRDLGFQAFALDFFSLGAITLGYGHHQGGAILQGEGFRKAAQAQGLGSQQRGPGLIPEGCGHDLRRPGGSLVHQHHHGG